MEEKETQIPSSLEQYGAKNDIFLNFDSEIRLKCLNLALDAIKSIGTELGKSPIELAKEYYNFIANN